MTNNTDDQITRQWSESETTPDHPTEPAFPRPYDVSDFDPEYTYCDKDKAVWSYYAPNRVWTRRDSRGWNVRGDYVPPAEYGPYTRIEKDAK